MILTPLQKLPKNVGDLGKLNALKHSNWFYVVFGEYKLTKVFETEIVLVWS